jgi:hypothetical protein
VQYLPRADLEQVPGADEIQGGIRRPEAADVQHPGQAPVRHEHVAGNEVTVGHHIAGRAARQGPHDSPHAAEPGNIQDLFAAAETRFHPRVMGSQVSAPALAAERPAARADGPHVGDELGKVARERDRCAGVLVGGHDAGQPRLHRPGKRVARPGFTERDRLGRAKPGAACQLPGCLRFGLQPAPYRSGVPGL